MKEKKSVDEVNKLYNQIFLEDFSKNTEFAVYAEKITKTSSEKNFQKHFRIQKKHYILKIISRPRTIQFIF